MKNCVKLSKSQNWIESLYPIHVVHSRKRDNDDYFVHFFSHYNKFISEYHHEALSSYIFLLQHQTCEVLRTFGVSPHFHHFWYNVKHFRHQKLPMFLSFPWSFCCKTKLVRCWKLWMFLPLHLSFLQHQAFKSPRTFNIFPPSLICLASSFLL